jgi:hypothetical protein
MPHPARPAATPMDAYRRGGTSCPHLEPPGIKTDSTGLTAGQNVPAIRAERCQTGAARDKEDGSARQRSRQMIPADQCRRFPRTPGARQAGPRKAEASRWPRASDGAQRNRLDSYEAGFGSGSDLGLPHVVREKPTVSQPASPVPHNIVVPCAVQEARGRTRPPGLPAG